MEVRSNCYIFPKSTTSLPCVAGSVCCSADSSVTSATTMSGLLSLSRLSLAASLVFEYRNDGVKLGSDLVLAAEETAHTLATANLDHTEGVCHPGPCRHRH